jgi:NADH:ubiquinone oxidoreductase subunit 6 (subunit J)
MDFIEILYYFSIIIIITIFIIQMVTLTGKNEMSEKIKYNIILNIIMTVFLLINVGLGYYKIIR